MNVNSRRNRGLGWVLAGGLVGALAVFGGGLLGFGTNSVPVVYASAEWVGDQSGALVGLDPEGKPTQAFPIKHTDVSVGRFHHCGTR